MREFRIFEHSLSRTPKTSKQQSVLAFSTFQMIFLEFSSIFIENFMEFPFWKGIVCYFTNPNESVMIFRSLTPNSSASATRIEPNPNFKNHFGLENSFLGFFQYFFLKLHRLSFPTVPFSPLDSPEWTRNKIMNEGCSMLSPVFS